MLHKCKMEITIRAVDNGWILEWTNGTYGPGEDNGVKVFTSLKAALDFAKGKL